MTSIALLNALFNRRRLSGVKPRFSIVSTREDGLCMRLTTILDAMLIAKAMRVDFAYHWDETEQPALDQQTTESLAAVFDAKFRRYRLTGLPDPGLPTLDKPLPDATSVASMRARGEAAGQLLLHRPYDLASRFGGLGPIPPDGYAKAFDSIGFAAPTRKAITAARSVPIPENAAVIHLRGGDILHGTHSYHGMYLHKAPSIAEIDTTIQTLRREGKTVWLIGQERDVQAAMVARHPGTQAFGLTHPTPAAPSSVEAVLFDSVFMSRMPHIFGGNSGVTDLARRLGRPRFTQIGRSLSTDFDDLDLHDDVFGKVSTNAKAHVYSKVVIATPPDRCTHRHLELIEASRRFRPKNAFLQLIEACVIARVIGAAPGEQAARALLAAPPLEPGITPDMGFSFLMGGIEYFPLTVVAHLNPKVGPATALLFAVGKALKDPAHRPQALEALSQAEAVPAPAAILPALRDRLLFCLNGQVGNL